MLLPLRRPCLRPGGRVSGLLGLVAVLLPAWPVPARASLASEGWQKLWQNQNGPARAAFRAALKQNPNDVDALRGLGLLADQEDMPAGALQAWRPLYRLAPGHWGATACWPRVVELAQRTGRWELLAGAARDVLASHTAPPALKASARLALAQIAGRSGPRAAANAEWAKLGFVRQWRVIGPFDNVSLSGFEKLFPPEREIDFKKSYPGKDDLSLGWRRLAAVAADGDCMVAASLGGPGSNLFYGVSAVYSPRAQAVAICLDATGASKLFLNHRLIFSDGIYRRRQSLVADPFRIAATLQPGWNTLLLKLADDEDSAAQFSLRVTAPDGSDGLTLPVDPNHVTGAPVVPAASAPAAPETAMAFLLRKAQGEESAAALGAYLRDAHDYAGSAEVLKTALAKAPACGWLHWELSQTLDADGQEDEAGAARDRARQENPRLVAAELGDLEDQRHSLPAAERIQRLKAVRKRFPESNTAAWALARAFDAAGLKVEALKTARAAVALAGGPEEIVSLASLYQSHDQTPAAIRLVDAALKTAPNDDTLLHGKAALIEAEGSGSAALYQRLAQLHPEDAQSRLRLAELYQASGKLKPALLALKAARELRPQDAQVCSQLADLSREMGRSQEAIHWYREAIRLAPAEVDLRQKLQLLQGEQPVVDLAPATPVAPILAQARKLTAMPGASAVVLLSEMRQVVYPDYARAVRIRMITKILDASAAEEYQHIPLSASTGSEIPTVERARVIKPDGQIQDVTKHAGGSSVAFPSLAVGDVVDLAYRVEDYPQSGALARQFWSEWYFSVPGTAVKLSRYVLITPPGMPFQTRAHGPVPEPAVKDVKGWRVREWRMTDLPARKLEIGAPGMTDTETWLDLSSITSWRTVVDWYRDLSHPRCVPDAAIRAKAIALTRGAKTDAEKLQALVAYVAREIRYQSTPFRTSAYVPTEGKQVLRERYGDCKDKAALLTALLSSVGIQANMVLLSGRRDGVTPYLPSPRFNHAIARVKLADGPVWVDATADQMEFGGFPSEDQGVPALVIDDATTDLVSTPALPVEKNRMVDSSHCVLAADNSLTGSLELTVSGDWSWILRTLLRRVPEANRDQVLRGLASEVADNCRYESGSMAHLTEPDQPLGLSFKYHVDRYGSTAGNFLLTRLPWCRVKSGSTERLLEGGPREQDADMAASRGHFVSSVTLELPAGYTPQDLQPEVQAESPFGSYRFTYRLEGNVLHAESEVKMTALRVAAADFSKFIEFLRAIDQEQHKQLVLKKSG